MKIVAAIDGSNSSEAAVDALTNLQLENGTEIKLLCAVEHYYQNNVSKAAEPLQAIAQDLQHKLVGCIISCEIVEGDAKTRITEIAKEWSANLIVMGSRGRTGLELMLLGSVSQTVLTQSHCPVVIAKTGGIHDPKNSFKKILITVDNSEYSRAALRWLNEIVWEGETQFKIVTVVPPLFDSIDSVESITYATNLTREHNELVISAQRELKKLSAELATTHGSKNISTEVGQGDPKEAILKVATDWSADLIVMGSHERTGINKLLLGSVSQAVALHAPCSVAIIRGMLAKSKKQRQTGIFSVPH